MNVNLFKEKVPSARKVAITRLPGYVFTFTLSADDQSTKANITASTDADAVVWGVLFEYADAELENIYHDKEDLTLTPVTVFDQDGNTYKADAIVAQPHAVNNFLLPYNWYLANIVKTAREAGLPEVYVNALSMLDSKTDPDDERRSRETEGI